jgi:hypothetical protein
MSGDTKPGVVEALSAVMEMVQAVHKSDRNQQQGFNFRGIDAVVNAVGPALRKHGVVAVPVRVEPQFEQYESRGGAHMRNTTLCITWRFYGPAGDYIEAQTLGEASDAGDKSVSKAHSVAYRTLLLQALCIPTDEPDPDAQAYERSTPDPLAELSERAEIDASIRALDEPLKADLRVAWDDARLPPPSRLSVAQAAVAKSLLMAVTEQKEAS